MGQQKHACDEERSHRSAKGRLGGNRRPFGFKPCMHRYKLSEITLVRDWERSTSSVLHCVLHTRARRTGSSSSSVRAAHTPCTSCCTAQRNLGTVPRCWWRESLCVLSTDQSQSMMTNVCVRDTSVYSS
jgi:hypothetical protein